MKKHNFVSLVMGTVGGLLFAVGMCMGLLPQWDAFVPGVIMGAVGACVLVAMIIVRRKMLGKEPVRINRRTAGIIALGAAGALVLGVGMCMTMVWEGLMVPGIIVGIVGIVMLVALIPVCKGIE